MPTSLLKAAVDRMKQTFDPLAVPGAGPGAEEDVEGQGIELQPLHANAAPLANAPALPAPGDAGPNAANGPYQVPANQLAGIDRYEDA